MDPDKVWEVNKALARPHRDALDRASFRDADRNFSAKRVFALTLGGFGVLAGGALWYLADSTLGERERLSSAPEIPLSRYISHMRAGTKPLVQSENKIYKPKYVQILGFAEQVGTSAVETNGASYSITTFQFVDRKNATSSLSTDTDSPALQTSSPATSDVFTVRFQISERSDVQNPFPLKWRGGGLPTSFRLVVPTACGMNAVLSSNFLLLNPISAQTFEAH